MPRILLTIAVASSIWASTPPAPAPWMQSSTWSAQPGHPLELRAAASASTQRIDVVARCAGGQERLSPELTPDSAPVWRYTPTRPAAVIIAVRMDPDPKAPQRVMRLEKLFIASSDPDRTPSASTMARFGQVLELTPLVDPTLLSPGADLPVKVKFDQHDLPNAVVHVHCDDDPRHMKSGQPVTTTPATSLTTNAAGLVNVRIDRAGVWSVSLDHTPGPADAASSADRFIGVLSFRVVSTQPDPKQNSRGDK